MAKFYFKPFITALLIIVAQLGNSQSAGTVKGWFDAGDFFYANTNATPQNDAGFCILQYDSGYYWVDKYDSLQPFNTFAAGHIFDVRHELWSALTGSGTFPVHPLANRDPFVWDSLRFEYFYLRGNSDTSVTDTLFIYYYCNFDKNDTQITTFIHKYDIADSLKLSALQAFNYTELSGKYFRKDTVLLKYGDTAGIKARRTRKTFVNKTFNGSAQTEIGPSNLFGYSLTFKPGFTHVQGDILFDQRDSSFSANVFGVYFIEYDYNGWRPPVVSPLYADNSLWLYLNFRYGGTVSGWTGFISSSILFAPHILHGAAFITGKSTVATNEVITHSLKLWPNPVSPGETITIEAVEQLPAQATITITDLLGRQVFCGRVENNYTIQVPLTEGIYNVVISSLDNSSSCSTKLIVINR